MALIASIQERYPHLNLRLIASNTHIRESRIRMLNTGKSVLKYMEQVALESMLPNETVAKLRSRYYSCVKPSNFWDDHFQGVKS